VTPAPPNVHSGSDFGGSDGSRRREICGRRRIALHPTGKPMPIAVIVTLAIQIALAIHVAKTGRSLYWIMIIVMLPLIGGVAYLVVEVLPGLGHDPRARRALRSLGARLDPAKNRRRIEAELAHADTLENRRRLAEECLRLEDYENAAALYRRCLTGVYASDPHFMLGLANALFGDQQFAECRDTLERLIAANPAFRSVDGHLLYARSLEAVGEAAKALDEYAILASSYPGEEARWRYAQLLGSQGRAAEAREVLQTMLKREQVAPRYYRNKERRWLDQARSALKALE